MIDFLRKDFPNTKVILLIKMIVHKKKKNTNFSSQFKQSDKGFSLRQAGDSDMSLNFHIHRREY